MNTIEQQLKRDCFYAAALGDALGVPFEFKTASRINEDYILHPSKIPKSYKAFKVPTGVFSDDFSQILMMEECLRDFKLSFGDELIAWMDGKYWTNGELFDIGYQTRASIQHLKETGEFFYYPEGAGNGSLMRTLPIAFLQYEDIAANAHYFSSYTHNSGNCLYACEFYSKLVHCLWKLKSINVDYMNKQDFFNEWQELERHMDWDIMPLSDEPIKGTGFVQDSLQLVYRNIMASESFVDCITRSIMHGGDTDSNTEIIAPVAALMFGMDDVPQEWHDMMKVNETNPYYAKMFGETK